MPTGRETQLTKQTGEYLVAAELCRMGFIAATFAGNVPAFDIIATTEDHRAVHVQVKVIRTGDWQPNADDYLEIEKFEDGRQAVHGIKSLPETVFVFVRVVGFGKDEFYILWMREFQQILFEKYRRYIESKGGVRPGNPRSTHSKLEVSDILRFKDSWDILASLLSPTASRI